MNYSQIQFIFNRALLASFSTTKLFFVFSVLALCGILAVFCRGLAAQSNQWMTLSLTFLPIFLCSGLLLGTGIILIRLYHDEIKQKNTSIKEILAKSGELVIGATYFCIPLVLFYLLLWVLLGIFMLLALIPVAGEFFGIILSFAPFLINFATLALCVLTLAVLFFVTPVVALKGLNRAVVAHILAKKFRVDPFSNLFLGMIALIPVLFFVVLLVTAAILTGTLCPECNEMHQKVLQWFFVMIPFTALLSPAVVFFFNFAAEAHVLIQKHI